MTGPGLRVLAAAVLAAVAAGCAYSLYWILAYA
jgi:hypothetical protein